MTNGSTRGTLTFSQSPFRAPGRQELASFLATTPSNRGFGFPQATSGRPTDTAGSTSSVPSALFRQAVHGARRNAEGAETGHPDSADRISGRPALIVVIRLRALARGAGRCASAGPGSRADRQRSTLRAHHPG